VRASTSTRSYALIFRTMTLIVLRIIRWSSRNCPKTRDDPLIRPRP